MESVHGHEVISLIKESNPPIQRKDLLSVITARFGNLVFHTCSKSNLSARELLEFLETADKLYFVNDEAHIRTSNVCSDDD